MKGMWRDRGKEIMDKIGLRYLMRLKLAKTVFYEHNDSGTGIAFETVPSPCLLLTILTVKL